MGTSKGYKMPTGGDWGPLKREATDFAQNVGLKPVNPQSLLRHYIAVRSSPSGSAVGGGGGNASGGAGGGGAGAGGGRAGSWSAGVATAQNIGGFLSRVGEVGLADALREIGLGDLVGKPAADISAALLDKLAGPGSTLDQAAARKALVELNDELLANAEGFEGAERALAQGVDQQSLFEILLRFFGHYLYECFCRDFYERLLKKVGSSQAAQSLKSIRDCINAAVKAKLAGRDVKSVDWHGSEGKAISEQILGDVLDIFEVPT
jgi:hypothetical protein